MKRNGIVYFIYVLMMSIFISACNGGSDGSAPQNTVAKSSGSLKLVLKDETNAASFSQPAVKAAAGNSVASGGELQPLRSSLVSIANAQLTPGENTTNEPNLDVNADSFVISGIGPNNESFEYVMNDRQGRVIEGLISGDWDIQIDAKNQAGVTFARGSEAITVRASDTTQAIVEVKMIEGEGSISLNVSWPKEIVSNPKVTAYLEAQGGEKIPVSVTLNSESSQEYRATASISGTLSSGYYALVFTVHEQDAQGNALHLAAGFAETVRIIAANQTEITNSLNGVKGVGSIDIGVDLNLNNILPIEFLETSTYPSSFEYDANVQFEVNADVPSSDEDKGNVVKQWYINGELVAIGDSFTINSAFSPLTNTFNGMYISGDYRLDVVAYNVLGTRSGSATLPFTVTGTQIGAQDPVGTVSGEIGQYYSNGYYAPVHNAVVELVSEGVSATESGSGFEFTDVTLGSHVLKVSASGFATVIKPITVERSPTLDLGPIVLQRIVTESFSNTVEKTLSVSDVATITFPANSIVNEDGSAYTGTVKVEYTALNPSSPSFLKSFPGEFRGITETNEVVDIASYGVVSASLLSSSNQPLKMKDGSQAEITIKVPDPSTAPTKLPLWHLDPATGEWTEEGEAILEGDKYVGKVGHFSWWNFDYVIDGEGSPWIRVHFEVVDEANAPVPNAVIKLEGASGFAYQKSVSADRNGKISTQLPFLDSLLNDTSGNASVFYTIQAKGQTLQSNKLEKRFFIDHALTYSKRYDYKIVLKGIQPDLAVNANTFRGGQPVANDGAAVLFNPENQTVVSFIAENIGEGQLALEAISVSPAGDWTLINDSQPSQLSQYRRHNFAVQYSGQNWNGDQAVLTVKSDDFDGDINVPLITVPGKYHLHKSDATLSIASKYKGTLGYRLEVDPYAPDPYAPGASEKVAVVNNGQDHFYLYEREHENIRGFVGFELSNLPKNIRVTGATLRLKSNYYPVKVYLGEQGEDLTIDSFEYSCEDIDDNCLLGRLPQVAYNEYANAELASEALSNLQYVISSSAGEKVFKLMLVHDKDVQDSWGASFNSGSLELVIHYEQ